MSTTIRFLKQYRGRQVGSCDDLMGFGVHDALVQRGIAEWATAPMLAGISEPVLSVPDTEPSDQKRRYNKKRGDQ